MQCVKPKFLSVKKEVEKKLQKMQFKCRNHTMGCTQVLQYQEVASHDCQCEFTPVKCSAYRHCKTKCIRKEIERHEAVCPYIAVPCIYCRQNVQRMSIIQHEQSECEGTHNCQKCGMTVQKEETQKSTHNCFTSLAGYLANMLDSKDYVIKMFKEEIERKNQLIRELLERQEYLETRLTKVEAVLLFDEEDLEAQTGIKREDDVDIEEEVIHKKDETTTQASGSAEHDSSIRQQEDEEKLQTLMQSEVEKFEQDLLTVDEEWRDLYKESMTFTDILKQEIFEPNQPWNKWQETKNYKIEVSKGHFIL